MVGILLMGPQLHVMETYDLPESALYIFAASLLYLPLLFFPTGLHLMLPKAPRMWITVVLQVLVLAVHSIVTTVVAFQNIQM